MKRQLLFLMFFSVCLTGFLASAVAQNADGWTPEGRDAWIREYGDWYDEGEEVEEEVEVQGQQEVLGPDSYDVDDPVGSVPFWDELNGKGAWIWTDELGWAWMPADRSESWQPYTQGQWVETDAGWYFESYEDYGSIVYHYGRWVYTSQYGWVWIPGRQWAPSWVDWRISNGHIGWAPLYPHWYTYDHGVDTWVFVETNYFLYPHVHRVAVPRHRVGTIYRATRPHKRWHRHNGSRYQFGPPPKPIRKASPKKPPKPRKIGSFKRIPRPRAYQPKSHPRARRSNSAGRPERTMPPRSRTPGAKPAPGHRNLVPRGTPRVNKKFPDARTRKPTRPRYDHSNPKARTPAVPSTGKRRMQPQRRSKPSVSPGRTAPKARPMRKNVIKPKPYNVPRKKTKKRNRRSPKTKITPKSPRRSRSTTPSRGRRR